MKNNLYLIFLVFVSCFSNTVNKENGDTLKFLKIDVLELFHSNDKTQIQLSIKVPTDKLVFKKSADGFNAYLSINAIFIDSYDNIEFSDNWDIRVNKDYFEETKQSKNIVINKDILIPIGKYTLNLIISDYENHISWIKNKEFELHNNVDLSDIFLFKKNNNEFIKINDSDISHIDTLWVQCYLTNSNNPINLNYQFSVIERNNDDKEIIFENNIVEYIKDNNMYYPIPLISDFFNNIEIQIQYMDTNREKTVFIDRYRKITYDYESLVGPMQYILENSNFKKLREYDELSENDKLIYIKDYWNVNDDENVTDLFIEFYNRVKYVNNNFQYLSYEGWRSDRGKIYIIYGKPYDIKNEFTMEGEYEIWTYRNNRQFVFINKYGTYVLSTYN